MTTSNANNYTAPMVAFTADGQASIDWVLWFIKNQAELAQTIQNDCSKKAILLKIAEQIEDKITF